jgi:hypothetical protein
MKKLVIGTTLFLCLPAFGQDTIQLEKSKRLMITGYVEGYYSYDFNEPENNTRPGFLYNFNRHNEFRINLGLIKAGFLTERTRASLALAAGTYMKANYAAEPGVLKNIFEANAGYKLTKAKNIWLDIGILPSHIGFESAMGKDNWTLTRSLVAESTPYFETGAKLSYTSRNGKWTLTALALNGWQRITRVEGNSLMSWGTQVLFKPSGKVTLNYSAFIGTDKPDSARQWRYHNNLYGIFQFSDKLGFIFGFDYGLEQNAPESNELNKWYAPVAILQITPNKQWAFALRAEYFGDEKGVIISTGTANGFQTLGVSLNLDYHPHSKVVLRMEGRYLKSKDGIFTKEGIAKDNNAALSFSVAVGL